AEPVRGKSTPRAGPAAGGLPRRAPRGSRARGQAEGSGM
ncbi:MAG: hypothetical protein AVDCRST_MAG19-1705, partial [uncultured Thermomicrobiales bacterium]